MIQQTVIPVSGANEFTFSSFVTGENAELVAHAEAVVQQLRAESMLFFWGGPGCGKTHLLNACCDLSAQQGRPYRYISMDYSSVALLAREKMEEGTLICLDNLHCWNNQNDAGVDMQLEILSLYERVTASSGHLLAAANCPLDQAGLTMADLQSRLSSGGTYRLEPMSDALKRSALQQRAKSRGFTLEDTVMDFIMNRFDRDTKSLFVLLDRIDSVSLSRQRKITIPLVREIIGG